MYERHAGFAVGATLVLMVKLVAAVRALTKYCAASEAVALLQVTLSFVPSDSSKVMLIWLFAVTAVLLTWTVVAAAAITTLPDDAELQTAGEALDEQLVDELNFVPRYDELLLTDPEAVTVKSEPPPFTRRSTKFPVNPVMALTPR